MYHINIGMHEIDAQRQGLCYHKKARELAAGQSKSLNSVSPGVRHSFVLSNRRGDKC